MNRQNVTTANSRNDHPLLEFILDQLVLGGLAILLIGALMALLARSSVLQVWDEFLNLRNGQAGKDHPHHYAAVDRLALDITRDKL